MPYKHYKEMLQYAEDAAITNEPWKLWEYWDGRWNDCPNHPCWFDNLGYRRKPKFININGYEVPEPVRTPLKYDEEYYYINLYSDIGTHCAMWRDDSFDKSVLKKGLVHLTEENAKIHYDALLSFTRIKD